MALLSLESWATRRDELAWFENSETSSKMGSPFCNVYFRLIFHT